MAFYTDWYDYDYQWDHDIDKVKAKLYELPNLMEQDANVLDRPYDSDIGIMLDGLREFYDAHKPNYEIARLIANILKKLCEMGKTNKNYDEALRKNISEYLELSTSIFSEDSIHLAQIKEYCESRGQKAITAKQKNFLDAKNNTIFSDNEHDTVSEIDDKKNKRIQLDAAHNLMNILNLKTLTSGGFNTEYSLSAIRAILTDSRTFDESALNICEILSEYNFSALNEKLNMHNEDIIIGLIYELLITLLENHKYMAGTIRRIKNKLDETNGIPKLSENAIKTSKVYGGNLARKNVDLEQKLIIAQSITKMQQMQNGQK